MSASKPLLVLLFPAVLAAPLVLPTLATAQQKTDATKIVPRAALTALAQPATSMAPRQSLPNFASVKATLSPILAAPAAKTVAAPTKTVALSAPKVHDKPVAALSAREFAVLDAPTPVAAIVPITRNRRAYVAAVSLATSPAKPLAPTPQIAVAPVVSAPVSVKAIAPLPTVAIAPTTAAAPATRLTTRPTALASREARAREIVLARLDAQLAGAEGRLNRAQSRLTEGQRQLGNVNSLLQNAMLSSGGNGLHPFVRVAQRYLGTPYVWGGESARGFDCSGFIMRVMRDLGYQALPHSAAEQFNYGKPVSKGLLQPGDIVFFANTYKPGISHVGIYLGGGRFIHAANSQVGTIVSNLNSAKWVAHYAGARRLMKMS